MTDNIINKFVDAEILLDESAYKKIKKITMTPLT